MEREKGRCVEEAVQPMGEMPELLLDPSALDQPVSKPQLREFALDSMNERSRSFDLSMGDRHQRAVGSALPPLADLHRSLPRPPYEAVG